MDEAETDRQRGALYVRKAAEGDLVEIDRDLLGDPIRKPERSRGRFRIVMERLADETTRLPEELIFGS